MKSFDSSPVPQLEASTSARRSAERAEKHSKLLSACERGTLTPGLNADDVSAALAVRECRSALASMGVRVEEAVGSADFALATLARSATYFGVLSSDTDFCAFPGVDLYLLDTVVWEEGSLVVSRVRSGALAASLGLEETQLPLFAALAGNDRTKPLLQVAGIPRALGWLRSAGVDAAPWTEGVGKWIRGLGSTPWNESLDFLRALEGIKVEHVRVGVWEEWPGRREVEFEKGWKEPFCLGGAVGGEVDVRGVLLKEIVRAVDEYGGMKEFEDRGSVFVRLRRSVEGYPRIWKALENVDDDACGMCMPAFSGVPPRTGSRGDVRPAMAGEPYAGIVMGPLHSVLLGCLGRRYGAVIRPVDGMGVGYSSELIRAVEVGEDVVGLDVVGLACTCADSVWMEEWSLCRSREGVVDRRSPVVRTREKIAGGGTEWTKRVQDVLGGMEHVGVGVIAVSALRMLCAVQLGMRVCVDVLGDSREKVVPLQSPWLTEELLDVLLSTIVCSLHRRHLHPPEEDKDIRPFPTLARIRATANFQMAVDALTDLAAIRSPGHSKTYMHIAPHQWFDGSTADAVNFARVHQSQDSISVPGQTSRICQGLADLLGPLSNQFLALKSLLISSIQSSWNGQHPFAVFDAVHPPSKSLALPTSSFPSTSAVVFGASSSKTPSDSTASTSKASSSSLLSGAASSKTPSDSTASTSKTSSSSLLSGAASSKPPASDIHVQLDDDDIPPPLENRSILPIHAHYGSISRRIRANPVTVLTADTGSGKSSQVPQFVLHGWREREKRGLGHRTAGHTASEPRILVTQPRRLAAETLAKRVAEEMGESEPGKTVGFRIGGRGGVTGPKTRITFATTGWVLQWLVHQREAMQGDSPVYTHVILDEVHERDVDTDLLCLVLRRLLFDGDGPPPFRLIVMSATLDAQLFARYFTQPGHPAPIPMHVGAKRFPVDELFIEDLPILAGLDPTSAAREVLQRNSSLEHSHIEDEEDEDDESTLRAKRKQSSHHSHKKTSHKKLPSKEEDDFLEVGEPSERLVEAAVSLRRRVPVHLAHRARAIAETFDRYRLPDAQASGLSHRVPLLDMRRDEEALFEIAAHAAVGLCRAGESVLVFVSGLADIEAVVEILSRPDFVGPDDPPLQVIPMHSLLPHEDQLRAFSEDFAQETSNKAVGPSASRIPGTISEDEEGAYDESAALTSRASLEEDLEGDMEGGTLRSNPVEIGAREPTSSGPPRMRIVVATNIAESSITIPGVTAVVDLGRHKEVRFDERLGAAALRVHWVSRASAAQRAGRSGRLQPGVVLRLFTRSFMTSSMAAFDEPEMLRLALDHVVLRVKTLSLAAADGTPASTSSVLAEAPQPPDAKAVSAALHSLVEVGAIALRNSDHHDDNSFDGPLTALGRTLASFPGELRAGLLLVYGMALGMPLDGVLLAAAASSQEVFMKPNVMDSRNRRAADYHQTALRVIQGRLGFDAGAMSDLVATRNAYLEWRMVPRLARARWSYERGIIPRRMLSLHNAVADAALRLSSSLSRRSDGKLGQDLQTLARSAMEPPLQLLTRDVDALRMLLAAALIGNLVVGRPAADRAVDAILKDAMGVDVESTPSSVPISGRSALVLQPPIVIGEEAFAAARALSRLPLDKTAMKQVAKVADKGQLALPHFPPGLETASDILEHLVPETLHPYVDRVVMIPKELRRKGSPSVVVRTAAVVVFSVRPISPSMATALGFDEQDRSSAGRGGGGRGGRDWRMGGSGSTSTPKFESSTLSHQSSVWSAAPRLILPEQPASSSRMVEIGDDDEEEAGGSSSRSKKSSKKQSKKKKQPKKHKVDERTLPEYFARHGAAPGAGLPPPVPGRGIAPEDDAVLDLMHSKLVAPFLLDQFDGAQLFRMLQVRLNRPIAGRLYLADRPPHLESFYATGGFSAVPVGSAEHAAQHRASAAAAAASSSATTTGLIGSEALLRLPGPHSVGRVNWTLHGSGFSTETGVPSSSSNKRSPTITVLPPSLSHMSFCADAGGILSDRSSILSNADHRGPLLAVTTNIVFMGSGSSARMAHVGGLSLLWPNSALEAVSILLFSRGRRCSIRVIPPEVLSSDRPAFDEDEEEMDLDDVCVSGLLLSSDTASDVILSGFALRRQDLDRINSIRHRISAAVTAGTSQHDLGQEVLHFLHDVAHFQSHALAHFGTRVLGSGSTPGRGIWRPLFDQAPTESDHPKTKTPSGDEIMDLAKLMDEDALDSFIFLPPLDFVSVFSSHLDAAASRASAPNPEEAMRRVKERAASSAAKPMATTTLTSVAAPMDARVSSTKAGHPPTVPAPSMGFYGRFRGRGMLVSSERAKTDSSSSDSWDTADVARVPPGPQHLHPSKESPAMKWRGDSESTDGSRGKASGGGGSRRGNGRRQNRRPSRDSSSQKSGSTKPPRRKRNRSKRKKPSTPSTGGGNSTTTAAAAPPPLPPQNQQSSGGGSSRRRKPSKKKSTKKDGAP